MRWRIDAESRKAVWSGGTWERAGELDPNYARALQQRIPAALSVMFGGLVPANTMWVVGGSFGKLPSSGERIHSPGQRHVMRTLAASIQIIQAAVNSITMAR